MDSFTFDILLNYSQDRIPKAHAEMMLRLNGYSDDAIIKFLSTTWEISPDDPTTLRDVNFR